jgi:hypothetical protein
MFLKLSYTEDKRFNTILRVITAITQDALITDVASLVSRMTAASWNTDLTSGFDATNSEVIRTVNPSTATMRYNKTEVNGDLTRHTWMTRFEVYDDPGNYWYVQSKNATNASPPSVNWAVGKTITGTWPGTTMSVESEDNISASEGSPVGTVLELDTADTANNNFSTSGNPCTTSNIRTAWVYFTDDCLIMAFTLGTSFNIGFNSSYSTGAGSATYAGPYIFSHYQRWDYHNTAANGVIPACYTNIWRGGKQGFGYASTEGGADWAVVTNERYQTRDHGTGTFRVMDVIDAAPRVGTSWPRQSFQIVNWGVGLRTNWSAPLTTVATGTTSTVTARSYGAVVHTTTNTRFVSQDLTSTSYALSPICWSKHSYNATGGNLSARGGFYLFNGEYFPGDEFVYGGKTYIIWPAYQGYGDRVGLAIPKE